MPRIVIIGAGVVGCSIALELKRRGARPVVIDRLGGAGHGSTSASCGIVRCFYSTRTMTAMAHEGASIWAGWREYLGAPADEGLARFERCGMLFFPPTIDANLSGILANMHGLGIEAELLSASDVRERFPYLDTASHQPVTDPGDDDFFTPTGREIAGAVHEPGAGYVVSPMLATENLRAAGEREGVTFVMGKAVEEIAHGDEGGARFRLRLEDGAWIDADVLVNVAGPQSGVVNALAGVKLPIETRALRREVHTVTNPRADAHGDAALPILGDLDGGLYFRPEARGSQLATGSLDPQCDVMEWVPDPDDWNTSCTVDAHERQVLRLMKRMPEVTFERPRGIAGLYDVTLLDWNPVLDRTDVPGYYVAMGTSGSSFKTAPVIGALMAELIDACEAGRDHDATPVRLTLPRTGFEVDVSFFSRLRSAHESTSTVIG